MPNVVTPDNLGAEFKLGTVVPNKITIDGATIPNLPKPIFVQGTGDTGTLTTDIGDVCLATCGFKNYFVPGALPTSEPYRFDPRQSNVAPAGLAYTITATVDCAVIINVDGTHTVTPANSSCGAGGWSYTYSGTNGTFTDSATVSGVVGNGSMASHQFACTGATLQDITITTTGGSAYTVDWGDGSPSVVSASGFQLAHTYGAPFTGNVTVSYPTCDSISRVLSNSNAFSFTLASLPSTLRQIQIAGSNTVSGSLSAIPAGVTNFIFFGLNTISGNLSAIPAMNTVFIVNGFNTITGSIASIPLGNTQFVVNGSNTVSGSLVSFPIANTLFEVAGNNTISGNLAAIPPGNTSVEIVGVNTITGNLSAISPNSQRFVIGGNNTISGNITSIPTTNTVFGVTGANTLVGSISAIPVGNTFFQVTGSSALSGSTGSIPVTNTFFAVLGNNSITPSATWTGAPSAYLTFALASTATGLSVAQVDQLLAALATITSWAGFNKTVNVAGANASPSAAGVASANQILANGATAVFYN